MIELGPYRSTRLGKENLAKIWVFVLFWHNKFENPGTLNVCFCLYYSPAVPNLFDTKDRFRGRQFFHGPGWGDGFGMIQVHYIYCALYFYYYYIVIYNEIIIQLTIMQNQWEPWAFFTCHSLIGFWYESASNWFIMVSVQSNLSANDNPYL